MVDYIRGSELPLHLQREVKARYVYRYTGEHKPDWARKPRPSGGPYPVQFRDDADWLAHTFFPVTKRGLLAERPGTCRSYPTWPDNPELRP